MHRRYNPAHFLLAVVIALVLIPLMVDADPLAQIAFSSDREGNFEIYVMDTDGRNKRRLTTNRHDDWDPSWSPDGTRIAFTSSETGIGAFLHTQIVRDGRPQIYVMDADGKNRRRLSKNPFAEWHPSWSPDGTRIAFTSSSDRPTADGYWDIYVMDANGNNPRNLTNHPRADWQPSWSPDGKHIAFVSGRDAFGWCIYVMDADGSNQQRLTDDSHADYSPSWSPDGEHIAFVSIREGNYEICVMDADGKNQRILTRNLAHDLHPSWSPDGKHIVFVSHRDGNYEIYTINAKGARQVRRLTKDGSEDIEPAWFDPAFAVEIAPFAVDSVGKKFTMWGWLKQVD